MKYSPGFRASIVRKTQDGSGRSVSEIARETGISYTTITSWIKRYETGRLTVDGAEGLSPHQRNPGEKLALLLESRSLSEEEKGEWLRQHGLHGEHLRLWEQELTTAMNNKQSEMNEAYAAVKKENKRLTRELKRKDKALADAAVLLTLKKSTATCLPRKARSAEKRSRAERDSGVYSHCTGAEDLPVCCLCVPGH